MKKNQALSIYANIDLTDDELIDCILRAKREKAGRIATREYWDKVNSKKEYVPMNYTEIDIYYSKLAKKIIPEFEINDFNENVYKQLVTYFSDLHSKKGLFLQGNVGCGKTTLMRIFSQNQKCSYKIVSCREVVNDFQVKGADSIIEYSNGIETGTNPFGQRYYGYCFDDLGTERESKHYGNTSNVLEDILLNRYDKMNLSTYTVTHVTTNLSFKQIEEMYGKRVLSRIKEMFFIIQFPNNSKDFRSK